MYVHTKIYSFWVCKKEKTIIPNGYNVVHMYEMYSTVTLYICTQRGEFITENLYLSHKPLKLLKKTLLGDPLKAFMIFFVKRAIKVTVS
jgi:hypothetical protein